MKGVTSGRTIPRPFGQGLILRLSRSNFQPAKFEKTDVQATEAVKANHLAFQIQQRRSD